MRVSPILLQSTGRRRVLRNLRLIDHPPVRKCRLLVTEDLSATCSRKIQKWLLIAPLIGIVSALVITGLTLTPQTHRWCGLAFC